jgi:broad specificity phosphatase PhoE/GNAT superfamily N-acetyltransferase
MSTRPQPQIRTASPADFAAVIRVVDAWWGRPMAQQLPRLFFQHFHDTSLIAEQEGRLVGFLVGFQSQAQPEQAYIHFVAVHPELREAGLGRHLYETFFARMRARGCRLVQSITSPVNRRSVAFHQAMGFRLMPGDAEVDGLPVHPDWDGQGTPRIRFERRLDLLFLVRHALPLIDRTVNMNQWQLDPQGQANLARLAALPSLRTARRIVASPEPKAFHTAEAIRAALGLPAVEPFTALAEIQKGGWVEDHDAVMARVFAEPAVPVLPGWESAASALARFRACVNDRLAETEGDLVIASHGTVISLYLADLLGQERVHVPDWAAIGFPDLTIVDPWGRRILQRFGAWAE